MAISFEDRLDNPGFEMVIARRDMCAFVWHFCSLGVGTGPIVRCAALLAARGSDGNFHRGPRAPAADRVARNERNFLGDVSV